MSLLTFLTITLVTRRGIPHYTRAQAAVDTVVRILRENAAGVRVVKTLACQVRERDRFDTANQAQRQAEAQAGQVMALANPITDLLLNAGLILVVLVGALRVNAGLMPPGPVSYTHLPGHPYAAAAHGRADECEENPPAHAVPGPSSWRISRCV